MAEIVNLNRARKAKARADRATQADAKRAKFGRTGAEKKADALERARAERSLDDAKRD